MCNFYPADPYRLCREDNLNALFFCGANTAHDIIPIGIQVKGGKRATLEHAPVPHQINVVNRGQQSQHVLYCYFLSCLLFYLFCLFY